MLFTFVGCTKETTKDDFMNFSAKCRAEEYYQICDRITNGAGCRFYCNYDKGVLFETYTMVEKCECDDSTFNSIKNSIATEFNTEKIVSNYFIDDIAYNVFLVKNENRLYDEFQEFGFILLSNEKKYIDFYWFYDQDYDMRIYDTLSFDEFFKTNFSWDV